MRTILVASSKGGAGKSTVATNLAAHYAVGGKATAILDADRQQSSTHWCQKRAGLDSAVLPLDGCKRNWQNHLPSGIDILVVDAPAGAMAKELDDYLAIANAVVVPVLPSMIDLEATVPFLNSLATHTRVRKGKLPVGIVANRLKPWTSNSQQALEQLRAWPYPLVAQLRDTQAYVLMAALGRSLFDYHSEQIRSHQEDWAPLLKWLRKAP
ncbi:MAG TPA: ParA family protein [Arenimonas sp.]|jgi:chromosome partitioning protein|nr:ParA family protein [Arenimonas sp.]